MKQSDVDFMELILSRLNAAYGKDVWLEISGRRKRGCASSVRIAVGAVGPQNGNQAKNRWEYTRCGWVWEQVGYSVLYHNGGAEILNSGGKTHLWSFMLHEFAHTLTPGHKHDSVYQNQLLSLAKRFPLSAFEETPKQLSADEKYFLSLIGE